MQDHSIRIDDFAPALIALHDLCKAANSKFNGNRAKSEIRINVELDQNCFEIQFFLNIIELGKDLIGHELKGTSEQILVWLGIIGADSSGIVGLFEMIKFFKGKKAEEAKTKMITTQNDGTVIQINIEGNDNTIHVYPEALEMYQEPRIKRAAQKILRPLEKEGFEKLEFQNANGATEKITSEEAKPFLEADFSINNEIIVETKPAQVINAFLRVYSPVYDTKAPKWRFEFGQDHEYVDISETTIATDAIARGGSLIDDTYEVELEITQHKTSSGRYRNDFKVLSVLDFIPAGKQIEMELSKKPE